jgi:hypothetical protein
MNETENVQFAYVTRDGAVHPINVDGVQDILDAADEIGQSIKNGDLKIDPKDIIKIIDTPVEISTNRR